MSEVAAVYVLLTTYQRTDLALRTIKGIKQYLQWPNLGWVLVDDGSSPEEVGSLLEAMKPANHIWAYCSAHKGVGHNMNVGLEHIWSIGGSLVFLTEDDWELTEPLDFSPYVNLLLNHEDIGYVRMGYLSAGVKGELISRDNRLWFDIARNPNYQYNYAGHAGLRHKRLFDAVGTFSEGLSPGRNELDFCSKYNYAQYAPKIVWPGEWGVWGKFGHIGGTSLSSVEPAV